MRRSLVLTSVASLLLALTATGCAEQLGGGLDIVNETDERVFFFEQPIPPGDTFRYEASDCSDSDVQVTDKEGHVAAQLTERWCPGQTWTIPGSGDGGLSDN